MQSQAFIPLKSHVFFAGYQPAKAFFSPLPPLRQTEAGVFGFILCGNNCFNFLCYIQLVLFYIIYFDLCMSLQ